MIIIAQFISSWDFGTKITSPCKFNTETNEVTDVVSVDVDDRDLYNLDEEYVLLPSGKEVRNFTLDGKNYVEGERQDEDEHLSPKEEERLRKIFKQ